MSVLVGALRRRGRSPRSVGALLCRCPSCRLGGIWVAIATLAFAVLLRRRHGEAVVGRRRRHLAAPGHPGAAAGDRAVGPRRRQGLPRARRSSCSSSSSLAVIQIREGTVGRTLRALRGSEVAAAVDRHLAGPGPDHRLRRLGVHRRPRRGAAEHPPGERELRQQLLAVRRAVLAGARGVARRPARSRGPAHAGAAFALFDAVVLKGDALRLDPARARTGSPASSRSRPSGASSSSASAPSSSPATPRAWSSTASARRRAASSAARRPRRRGAAGDGAEPTCRSRRRSR